MGKDFGIIVACSGGDYRFAKALVASIRHFCGRIPICLLVDGSFSTRGLRRAYDVQALYRADVHDDFLRRESFGYGVTKMVAFWESPYERFLYLDADTLMWGDVTVRLRLEEAWDVFADRPRYTQDANKWFFDTILIGQMYPDFPWQKFTDRYFCTGVFGARRGVFDLSEYRRLLSLARTSPSLFHYGEMGLLNFMIFNAVHNQRISVASDHIQVIMGDFEGRELEARFNVGPLASRAKSIEPVVLHYTAGPKPDMASRSESVVPGIEFRRRAVRRMFRFPNCFTGPFLRAEDFRILRVPSIERRVRQICRLRPLSFYS